jgi:hypothetical protein
MALDKVADRHCNPVSTAEMLAYWRFIIACRAIEVNI